MGKHALLMFIQFTACTKTASPIRVIWLFALRCGVTRNNWSLGEAVIVRAVGAIILGEQSGRKEQKMIKDVAFYQARRSSPRIGLDTRHTRPNRRQSRMWTLVTLVRGPGDGRSAARFHTKRIQSTKTGAGTPMLRGLRRVETVFGSSSPARLQKDQSRFLEEILPVFLAELGRAIR
jgi:hypothetical protein